MLWKLGFKRRRKWDYFHLWTSIFIFRTVAAKGKLWSSQRIEIVSSIWKCYVKFRTITGHTFAKVFNLISTKTNTLPQYPGGDCSTHRGKCQTFRKIFSRVRPRSNICTGETRKPTGDNKKIQRGELTNISTNKWPDLKIYIPDWPKNKSWVKLKCQKSLVKYCIRF